MPIRPPALDDRSFDDLVEELIARIPAHTPEWTDPRPGDPGRTLIDLFAWLGDTLLYRANLIPERQRLAFLRLLGVPLRPAIAAQGIVSLEIDTPTEFRSESIQPLATLTGAVPFETRQEITIHPVQVAVYCKQRLDPAQLTQLTPVVEQLEVFHNLGQTKAVPYITTPVFSSGQMEREGVSLQDRTIDRSLWLALLAPKPEVKTAVIQGLGTSVTGAANLLNIGIVPTLTLPEALADVPIAARIPHVWEISVVPQPTDTQPRYLPLTVVSDSTQGLTRLGVVRLALPAVSQIGAPSNDVRQLDRAGVGDYPPRIDAPEVADRLVAWIRLRPLPPRQLTEKLAAAIALPDIRLSWIGINAVEIDQRQTLRDRIIGQSDGTADQVFALPGQSVEAETLVIQVEETGRGYQVWLAVSDLALANPQSAVYQLDSEAGTIRFGDGMRGRVPEVEARIRVALVRLGGGDAGNLPSGSLTAITATRLTGGTSVNLKVTQPLATTGGAAAETLDQAERRIPALFRHRDRAITPTDYEHLASETPGVSLGRVEVLPHFKPQQRRQNMAGVVSVMVLPNQARQTAPNPRPDRPTLERIHAYLEARRPLGTELYVIGCEYQPLGLSVGIEIADGFERDQVLLAVRSALQQFLWPLAPGGAAGKGWPLGRTVQERELIVIAARVAGVSEVLGLNLFRQRPGETLWQRQLPPTSGARQAELPLSPWQMPELLSVVVLADTEPLGDLDAGTLVGDRASIPVPVVPEVC